MANSGHKIGLLHGTGTRMASFFYVMHCMLCLCQALLAMVHSAEFNDLKTLPKNANYCIADIMCPNFWKATYVVLRAVFPALQCLCFCDSHKPAMDKIYYLVHHTTMAINKSIEILNDPELFGPLYLEDVPDDMADDSVQVFGDEAEE